MGCDIHLFVEKKVNGAWEALKGINEPRIQDFHSMLQRCKKRGEGTSLWVNGLKRSKRGRMILSTFIGTTASTRLSLMSETITTTVSSRYPNRGDSLPMCQQW
ncbi:hypothetical protein B1222_00030 [Paenibacillus larvae subsp. pulvifaciens]|uniref:hypothetical protein n=1 Tax=Paenibacillus larvae TaxID=1464 RepID=UPI0009900648|nr:hypothetical protein [Paenibacillus larvae]AQT83206.1 hypothetical protein B1222_00030 [Paenibacillus larvae subsp. pulvifaciens]